MARLTAYPNDVNINVNDKVIGTNSAGGGTKNFTLGGIAGMFNEKGAIAVAGQSSFKFQTDLSEGRASGTLSFSNGGGAGSAFSSMSSLRVSKYNSGGSLIIDYLSILVDQYIILGQVDNANNFSVYKLTALTQDSVETDFYNATLTHIESNGNILGDKYYAFAIYPAPTSVAGDNHYEHNQNNAASTWNITHNLGKYPSVSITLSTGVQGIGAVEYIDSNSLTVTLISAESGYAYLN